MPGHGPRDDQLAHLSPHRLAGVAEALGGHAGDGAVERARLDGRDGEAGEDAARDLGAPRVVDDGHPALPGVLEEPAVGLGVPGLAGGADDAQGGQVVAGEPVRAVRHERPHRGRRDAEVRDPVALHQRPQAVRLRVVRRALEEHDGAAHDQGAGDEHRPHQPAEVGHPEHAAVLAHVEDVRPVVRVLEPETALGEHGALGPPGGAGGVDDDGGVVGLDRQRLAVRRLRGHRVVPPDVAARASRGRRRRCAGGRSRGGSDGHEATASSAVRFMGMSWPRRAKASAVMSTRAPQPSSRVATAWAP